MIGEGEKGAPPILGGGEGGVWEAYVKRFVKLCTSRIIGPMRPSPFPFS